MGIDDIRSSSAMLMLIVGLVLNPKASNCQSDDQLCIQFRQINQMMHESFKTNPIMCQTRNSVVSCMREMGKENRRNQLDDVQLREILIEI
jgi:hypothetical protein